MFAVHYDSQPAVVWLFRSLFKAMLDIWRRAEKHEVRRLR